MLKKVRKWTKFIGQTKGPVIIYVKGGGKKGGGGGGVKAISDWLEWGGGA